MTVPVNMFDVESISAGQLALIAKRLDLGALKGARPTNEGTSATTLYLECERGRFVLRACADANMLRREGIHAELIHKHTPLAAPQPYELDQSRSIISVPYAVMPQLPGHSPADLGLWKQLSGNERSLLTRAIGEGLHNLHGLRSDRAGYFPGKDAKFEPFAEGYARWQLARLDARIEQWKLTEPALSPKDLAWARTIAESATNDLSIEFTPVYVHHDYTLGNILVQRINGRLSVTGVVDLTEGHFALGEADFVRTIAMFGLDHPRRISEFLSGYLQGGPLPSGHESRFKLFMLEDRLTVWLAGRRLGHRQFPNVFRRYAEPYLRLTPFEV